MYNQTHGSVFIYVPSIVPCMDLCYAWGYNFTSRSEGVFPYEKVGETSIFRIHPWGCAKISRNPNTWKMEKWWHGMWTSCLHQITPSSKSKKTKKLIYYRGFGAFRVLGESPQHSLNTTLFWNYQRVWALENWWGSRCHHVRAVCFRESKV